MSQIYDPALSDFDIDFARGSQGELWVKDLRLLLAEDSVEVKTDAKHVATGNFYVEYECQGRDGIWRPSGIQKTKAKCWMLKWGKHPAGFAIETNWLKRAAKLAKDAGKIGNMKYGQNPTRGALVNREDLIATRDVSLDEHKVG